MSHAPGGQFADPVDAWIENATIEVDIDQATDSIQIYGNDGSANRAILTDALGRLITVSGGGVAITMGAPASVTVGVASTEIIAAEPTRRYAIIVNDSNEDMYLGIGAAAVMNAGIRLNKKGGAYEVNADNLTTQAINGITASGGNNATATEGT